MPKPLYCSPYPKVELSLDEKEHLHETLQNVVHDVMERYETFMWKSNSSLDASQWELLRSSENLRMYHDRRPGGGTLNKFFHQLLTEGTMPGTLNDAMYGELAQNIEAMRLKTAYIRDSFIDSAVLETIEQPTVDTPFQSMTVRWCVKQIPFFARAIAKNRDFLYLEATGVKKLSNGEEVGYQLMHSIEFPQTPVLPKYLRVNFSFCTLYRQMTPTTLQIFRTAFIEMHEPPFIASRAMRALSEDVLYMLSRVIYCAQHKKLAVLVQNTSKTPTMHHNSIIDGCAVCGSQARGARRGVKSMCAICGVITCGDCRDKRTICVIGPDRQLLELKMRFCRPCIASARQLDGAAAAQDELRSEQRNWFSTYRSTSSIDSYSVFSGSSST